MEEKDLYGILAVARGASEDEIRTSYRKLARKYAGRQAALFEELENNYPGSANWEAQVQPAARSPAAPAGDEAAPAQATAAPPAQATAGTLRDMGDHRARHGAYFIGNGRWAGCAPCTSYAHLPRGGRHGQHRALINRVEPPSAASWRTPARA